MILQSLGLGVGLAVDAFSVSIADGLAEPRMSRTRKTVIPLTFAIFQFAMPLIGWLCIHTIAQTFKSFEKAVPWIALILLLYIGGKMLIEGIRSASGKGNGSSEDRGDGSAGSGGVEASEGSGEVDATAGRLTPAALLLQGVATSIDALSVGFAFAAYAFRTALMCSAIIGAVTFLICILGIALGNRIGSRLTGRAEIVGGIILILIGIEIFIRGVLH